MAESTVGKWHVNGEGKPGVCKAAKGGCPFRNTDGGTGLGHFDTKQEAEAAYASYAAAMAKMNGTSSLSKKSTTGGATGDTVEATPRTIGGWKDKLKRDASAKTSSTCMIKAGDLQRFSESGFIDPATTGVHAIYGVPITSANIGRKYLTYTNTNGAVNKLPLDENIQITLMEPSEGAHGAMRSLLRVNEIDEETSREKSDAVSALGNKINADLAAGEINDSAIKQYNEAQARLDYFWDVRDRLNVGMTPEQAKLDATAAAIDEYQKAEAGDYGYENDDLMALRARAGAAMNDIFRDWELSEDADWSISADDEREFEEDLSLLNSKAAYSQAKTGGEAGEGFLNGAALDPRKVKALSKANWELAAIRKINEHRTEDMAEGEKLTMFESAKDYVFANGVHSYSPYDRSTSTIANAHEDGAVDAKMAIASLVFFYAVRSKKTASQKAQIASGFAALHARWNRIMP